MGEPGNDLGGAAGAPCRGDLQAHPTIFPQLGTVEIAKAFCGAVGQTVHGMPQIGQLRPGLWVASGFGRQGLNTSAMAGQLIARGMLEGDDRGGCLRRSNSYGRAERPDARQAMRSA